jgi:hypothetical protein
VKYIGAEASNVPDSGPAHNRLLSHGGSLGPYLKLRPAFADLLAVRSLDARRPRLAIKEVQAKVTLEVTPCPHCGHPGTEVAAPSSAGGRLWLARCPVCRHMHEYAAIPLWFLDEFPARRGRRDLH